jgi:DNA-binding NtrC family response regulator
MARILVVDDEQDLLWVLKALFEGEGYEVEVCQDGNEAIDLIKGETKYDLMISDVRMSPVNGVWLLSFAKDQCPDMPVIMITAFYTQEKAAEAMKLGALAYLPKPFDTKKLIAMAKEAVEKESA